MTLLLAFLFGVVFAVGLGLAGMTHPSKVIGFLDITGHWDPTLAFVMGGAVVVGLVLFPRILRRQAPVLAPRFVLPEKPHIDAPLLVGAALFGIGWGLSGYCPGPAVVSLITAAPPVLVFVVSMLAGLLLGGWIRRAAKALEWTGRQPQDEPPTGAMIGGASRPGGRRGRATRVRPSLPNRGL